MTDNQVLEFRPLPAHVGYGFSVPDSWPPMNTDFEEARRIADQWEKEIKGEVIGASDG